MRCDGDNGDHILARTVVPEDPIGTGGVVFGIGLENVFAVWAAFGRIFVRVNSWVSGIVLEFPERRLNGLSAFQHCRVQVEFAFVPFGCISEHESAWHGDQSSSFAYLLKSPA